LRFDQVVEERAFTGVRIADERNTESLVALTRTALRAALFFYLVQALLDCLDAIANHSAVKLNLRLSWATAIADAAALSLQVAPATHQARRQVLQARQLDLQLAFVALRALAEYLQDQHGAIGHRHTQMPLQIALLSRRQGLVKKHGFCLMGLDQSFDFVGFP